MNKIRSYYNLTKPGIIMGNTITAIAGFALAAQGTINVRLFTATIIGLGVIVASACVFNNYIDRGIDKKMQRTRNRGLASGTISSMDGLVFASLLGALGVWLLVEFTTFVALAAALVGFFVYVFVYAYAKRHTSWGTEIGSIAGAVPPVVGYAAVSGRIDTAAVLLFLILVLWQMPHFFAIAMYRLKDYEAAEIPVLPARQSMAVTKRRILIYVGAFLLSVPLLTIYGYTGVSYLIVATSLAGWWLWEGLRTWNNQDDEAWARGMFRLSLVVITGFCIIISIDSVLQ